MFRTKAISTLVILVIASAIFAARSWSVSGTIGDLSDSQAGAVGKDSSAAGDGLPNLQGEEAVAYLKEQGLYPSLGAAMKAARYGVYESRHSLRARADEQFYADNLSQQYQAYFSPESVRLSAGKGEQQRLDLVMKFKGLGYGDSILAVTTGQLKAKGNRIEIERTVESRDSEAESQIARGSDSRLQTPDSRLVEWYVNRESGLEQGFTIERAPGEAEADQRLRLRLEMSGTLRAEVDEQAKTLWLMDERGRKVMSYNKLSAYDARGRELESQMKVEGREVWLEVDDSGAEYPVTIDPVFEQVKKLTASDGATGDAFGISVSISGSRIVVGAGGDDDAGFTSGSAYVFERNDGGADLWGEVTKLTASDGAAGDLFGNSVSISGDTIIVGASRDDSQRGSAYVFERNEGGADLWGEVTKLTASDRASPDQFGFSVSISGDTLVVGAHQDNTSRGSAYVYERNQGGADNWGEVKKLTASDGVANDVFGQSVSISGDTLVVGAIQDDSGKGSAYVFERNQGGADNWGEVKKLTASDGAANDNFGESVAISGDTLVVGAYLDDDAGNASGAAYVYERNQGGANNWGEVTKLTASDRAAVDQFGNSVSISGSRIVVGAIGDDSSKGSAYVFERNEGGADLWGEVKKLTASDGAANDFFGQSVSISGDSIVVGASEDDDAGSSSGSAYVFANDCEDWVEQDKQTASDRAANDSFGFSVSISDDTIVVGSFQDDDAGGNSGSAYVFERNDGGADNWGEVKKLTASDAEANDQFGQSVSISGSRVVVGANRDDSGRGAAYLYERNQGGADNWGEVKKLTASDGAAPEQFGFSVSISGSRVVVSANRDDARGTNSGSAYVFERNEGGADNWGEVKKLTASDGEANDNFGQSVSISGDTIVVGANIDDSSKGAAYVYERNQGGADNWGQVKKLTASDGAANDNFGQSVSISGDTIVVGALEDDDAGSNSGSAYVFERNEGGADLWGEVTKLTASDSAANDNFGRSVSISGDTVAVSANGDDSSRGSTYIFTVNCSPVVTTSPVSLNQGTSLTGAQIATVSDDITPASSLSVTVDSSPAGIIVSKIVNMKGVITADLAASCAAQIGANTVTLTVTDGHGLVTMAGLTVNVSAETTPPVITCPGNITKSTDSGQCSAVVNFTATANDNCDGALVPACAPPSGFAFPKGTTTVTCSATDTAGNTGMCSFTVTVIDTQAPTINCPANRTVVTARSGDASVSVTYSTPTASDSCGTPTIVCNPPSGSTFSVGTTTVTCTATDAAGNSSSCNFTISVFDVCLQDDSNASTVLLWNSVTGDYRFCCAGTTFSGRGTIMRKGNAFTLTHNVADRRVNASLDAVTNRGSASLQSPVGTNRCAITDRDTRNNSCQCQ